MSLAGREHGRLQDVATASVVLETAIIKVHRSGQGLEIESNCTTPRWQRKKGKNVHRCFNQQVAFQWIHLKFAPTLSVGAAGDLTLLFLHGPLWYLLLLLLAYVHRCFSNVNAFSQAPLVCLLLEHTAFCCGLASSAATRRAFESLLCRTAETLTEAARPEGKRLFISCFDRIFTVWRCSRLSLKNPVWKEGAGKEPAAGNSRRRAGMTPSFLCNRQHALPYCSLWSSAIPPIEFVKNDWCSNSSHKGLKEMIWIGFSFGRVGGSTWRGGPEPCWKELVLDYDYDYDAIKTDFVLKQAWFHSYKKWLLIIMLLLISFILHCGVIFSFFVLFYISHLKHESCATCLRMFKSLIVVIHVHSLWFQILAPSDSPSWQPTFQNSWGL